MCVRRTQYNNSSVLLFTIFLHYTERCILTDNMVEFVFLMCMLDFICITANEKSLLNN